MPTIIQLRRDTYAEWNTVNPLLAEGELGIETDTLKYKLGDGVHHWSQLPYAGPRGVFPEAASVEILWDENYPSNHSEITYASGKIAQVKVWDSPSKANLIFTKSFSYTSGLLSSVVITHNVTGATITKTISISGGLVTAVDRTYTP